MTKGEKISIKLKGNKNGCGKRSPRSIEWSKKISDGKKGKKLSEEHKRKLSAIKKGKMPKNIHLLHTPEIRARAKLAMQKGGILKVAVYRHYRNSEYIKWRRIVYERDNYTCLNCGVRGVFLHPHHIKSYTYYPEDRYDVENGVTLCVSCHHQLHFGH